MLSEVGGLAIAAHELKSPLAVMRQLALSMDFAEDSRLELEQTRDELVTISERALRQVNDLTKVARLEDGLFFVHILQATSAIFKQFIKVELT